MRPSQWLSLAFAGLLGIVLVGCNAGSETTTTVTGEKSSAGGANLSGAIAIDGSSTVFPITEAVAEEFQKANAGVRVTVGISGTGGGFKKFGAGETDISNASRPIEASEIELATKNNVEFIELPIAFDGLSVVVNKENTWVDFLSVDDLKKIWEPDSKVKTWADVRAGWPAEPIKLYGPGTDSGTFDYFTKAIVGKEKASRSDYQASEDDNTLVTGVAGDKGALGYFGFAYYEENQDKLKLVPIKNGDSEPVAPSKVSIADGTYKPLSRPEFIYVKKAAAARPEVKAFVEFYLSPEGRKLVSEVGYIPLPDSAYELALKRFQEGKAGSVFSGGSQVGVSIEELLK